MKGILIGVTTVATASSPWSGCATRDRRRRPEVVAVLGELQALLEGGLALPPNYRSWLALGRLQHLALAPQLILPPRRGRTQFLAGAGLVGAASTRLARRTCGLRWVLLAHVLTNACGVQPTLYRLGRLNGSPPPPHLLDPP